MSPALAAGLPKTLAWSAYDVGSTGYSQAVAIGAALKNERGVTLRVLPGKNDMSRLVPLKQEKVQFSAFGVGGYQAQEGVFEFGVADWGPQKLRLLAMSNGDFCNAVIVAGDIGVKTYADLKGKRVAFVRGAPALNHNVYAFLRFGGLEWSDVKQVVFGGYGASMDAIVADQVDAGNTNTTAGFATKIMSSPRGGYYPPMPHADKEAWQRMRDVAPYFYPSICSEGVGITQPFEGANYPYPILIAYDTQDPELSYEMTKAVFELYPVYKDSAPGANGWALDKQVFDWVVPFHAGAVRYLKEAGKWTPELQAHNDKLVERQQVLAKAWGGYKGSAPSDEEAFAKGWQKARAEALTAAGMKPVWTEW
jgi:TRAP transporter TAXI family solute receptor